MYIYKRYRAHVYYYNVNIFVEKNVEHTSTSNVHQSLLQASVGLVVQHYVRLPGFERAGTDWESQFNTIVSIPALYQFSS